MNNKTKERVKQTGEVFTPSWLVNEILDKLPEDQWTNSSKTFIDPACGNGNILVEIVRRKIESGAQPLQACKDLASMLHYICKRGGNVSSRERGDKWVIDQK